MEKMTKATAPPPTCSPSKEMQDCMKKTASDHCKGGKSMDSGSMGHPK